MTIPHVITVPAPGYYLVARDSRVDFQITNTANPDGSRGGIVSGSGNGVTIATMRSGCTYMKPKISVVLPVHNREDVLARAPNQPGVWVSYGHMLKTVGRQADGIAAYRKAIAIKPTHGEAWWSLANLKTVKFDEGDIQAMQAALEKSGLSDPDRFHLDFALGKAMHDAKRTDEAFAHYSKANALRLKSHPYRPRLTTTIVDRCIAAFTAEAFAERQGGCDAPDPIFIVGLPRAGSTLLRWASATCSRRTLQSSGTSRLRHSRDGSSTERISLPSSRRTRSRRST